MTSAPMSASIIPAVGPAMICASSSTRMPESGPVWAGRSGTFASTLIAWLTADEFWLLLGEKGRVADTEVFGVKAVEALVQFLRRQGRAFGKAPRELLVPASDEWGAVDDACGSSLNFRSHLVIGDDSRHEPLVPGFDRVEDATFEQDLESNAAPDQSDERRHLRVGHHQPEVLDRRTEAARRAADADVGQCRDLQPAADADAMDLRDDR